MRALIIAVACVVGCSSPSSPQTQSASPADAGGDDAGDLGADAAPRATCETGAKSGDAAGATLTTSFGTTVVVRTPPTYDPDVGSPLVVVYAPLGAMAKDTERFTGLTPLAKSRGYLIAYADHIEPSATSALSDAEAVVQRVTAQWCVDIARVYLTGHSDGATITEFIAKRSGVKAAAIAPSAAGARTTKGVTPSCAARALPEMEIHGSKDTTFPVSEGYGADMAAYWASCEGCAPSPVSSGDGCVVYPGCRDASEVRYCEWAGAHPQWPSQLNGAIFDFFDRFRLAP